MASRFFTSRVVSTGLTLGIAVACGGQSLTHEGTGGTTSVGGGSGSGGSSGKGGSPGSGGSPGGGGSPGSGGVSGSAGRAGRGQAGGGALGGSSGRGGAGGSSGSGSAGIGGTGALAGQGGATSEVCSLPLESGPCDAAITRYGFNPKTQRCEPFGYGGCEGNENNFETFEACVMACGLAVETGCPNSMPPTGTACMGPQQPCDYTGTTNCLCQPHSQYTCEEIAPSCNLAGDFSPPPSGAAGACSDPGCIEEVVLISYYTCSCDSTWSCVIGGQTRGGPL